MKPSVLPHLVKNYPDSGLLIHDGQEFRTSQKLLDVGMACCPDCGNIFSTFPIANFCDNCNEFVLVITEGIHLKPVIEAKPLEKSAPKDYDLSENCPVCNTCLHEKAAVGSSCYHRHTRFRYRNRNRLISAGICEDYQFRQRRKK